MENHRFMAEKIKEEHQTESRKIIKEVFDKFEKDNNRFGRFEIELRKLKQITTKFGVMERQVEECLLNNSSNVLTQNFVKKSLPILMHLQICEALDSVVGDHFQMKLLKYEKNKNEVIYNYSQQANMKCIKINEF